MAKKSNTPPPSPSPAADPFNVESLRLTDSSLQLGVKRQVVVVPVGKPQRQAFVRVHPSEEYRMATALFEDKINREIYLVARPLWEELAGEIQPAYLFTAITRHGGLFLWKCVAPDQDGRRNNWHDSMLAAAQMAVDTWVRVSANMANGSYDVFAAAGDIPDPVWPELSFEEILDKAFSGRKIGDIDHPVLQQLRGE